MLSSKCAHPKMLTVAGMPAAALWLAEMSHFPGFSSGILIFYAEMMWVFFRYFVLRPQSKNMHMSLFLFRNLIFYFLNLSDFFIFLHDKKTPNNH